MPLECLIGPDEEEQVANKIQLCLKRNNMAGSYTLTSDLPPEIEVISLGYEPNGVDGGIIANKSVRITNPDMGELILWCCQIKENGMIVEREHHHLIKIPSDDDPGGKYHIHFTVLRFTWLAI